jgi:hypothetical protein
MKRHPFLFFFLLILMKPETNIASDSIPDQRDRCVALLRKVLHEQPEWIKVHAAEYLLWAGYREGVKEVFLEENKLHGNRAPYRIGIWRVLAQSSVHEEEKNVWIGKIKNAFLDPHGPDRLHASETLAKLRISPMAADPVLTENTLESEVKPLAIYTLWSVAFSSEKHLNEVKTKLLSIIADPQNTNKSIAAYAIRQLGNVKVQDWNTLSEAALKEQENSASKVYLLSSAFVTFPEYSQAGKQQSNLLHAELLKYKNAKSKGERSEMAMALAEKGTAGDIPVLMSLLNNENPLGKEADDSDVMAATAYAILRIGKR